MILFGQPGPRTRGFRYNTPPWTRKIPSGDGFPAPPTNNTQHCVCVCVACFLSCATSCVVPERLHPRNMGTPLFSGVIPDIQGATGGITSPTTINPSTAPLHLCRTGICPIRCGLLCRRRAKASGLKGLVFRGESAMQIF